MSNGDTSPRVLRGGEFYTPVTNSLRAEQAVLSELQQPCARQMPHHEHALAYFTVVLQGHYAEQGGNRLFELQPFTAIFNPVGAAHRSMVGSAGATLFTIELPAAAVEKWKVRLPEHPLGDFGRGAMLWPGLRLYSAFKTQCADSFVIESYILEMLAALEQNPVEKYPPPWFRRVKERLHEEFRDNLRMRDLASEAGVHPVHLARMFRTQEKQTPGKYLQRLRIRAACRLLRDPEYPLAAIAAECGFADQSHFTRVFKKITETTPARFRQTVANLGGG